MVLGANFFTKEEQEAFYPAKVKEAEGLASLASKDYQEMNILSNSAGFYSSTTRAMSYFL